MFKTLLVASTALSLSPAFADGFLCHSDAHHLNVKLFNHTRPEMGTRNPAVMIISDREVAYGRKTIGRFFNIDADATEGLRNYRINLATERDIRGGEYIAGTRLMYVRSIGFSVNFSYDNPVEEGAALDGSLMLTKTNGEIIRLDLDCTRYLNDADTAEDTPDKGSTF